MHDTRAGLCCVSTDEEKAIPAKISAHPQEAVHRCHGPKHPSGNTVHRHGSNLPDAGRRFLWSHMHAHWPAQPLLPDYLRQPSRQLHTWPYLSDSRTNHAIKHCDHILERRIKMLL